MTREIILLAGPCGFGKTTLAKMLTDGSRAEANEGGPSARVLEYERLAYCDIVSASLLPRVVICAHNENEVRNDIQLRDLFDGARVWIWRIAPGDSSPLLPLASLAEVAAFKRWLKKQDTCAFRYRWTGTQKEWTTLRRGLPRPCSFDDLLDSASPLIQRITQTIS
jgi:uncharacterized protein YuzB (UPF0349 family)